MNAILEDVEKNVGVFERCDIFWLIEEYQFVESVNDATWHQISIALNGECFANRMTSGRPGAATAATYWTGSITTIKIPLFIAFENPYYTSYNFGMNVK